MIGCAAIVMLPGGGTISQGMSSYPITRILVTRLCGAVQVRRDRNSKRKSGTRGKNGDSRAGCGNQAPYSHSLCLSRVLVR